MLEGLFQPMHLIVILAIALLVVGPKKLPELGAGIGKSIREFKKAMSDMDKPSITPSPAGELKQDIKKDTKDAG
jgi:sec-independent protein translocase protein TatA